jgi:hypothetical protein
MAIDKESIEERNDGLRESNKYYQAQVEYLSRSVDLSNTLLDTLKEELGIHSRRQTSEQNLLEINKKINKELINQRVGLNTISDIEKQITKNKKLGTATDTLTASLTTKILTSGKQYAAVTVETANELAKNLATQKENQILIDEINKEIADGNALRVDQLIALENTNSELDNEIETAYSLLDTDGKRLAITQAQSFTLGDNIKRREEELKLVTELNNSLGVTGKILDLIGSIPGIGSFAKKAQQEVIKQQKFLVDSGAKAMSTSEALEYGAKKLGEGISEALNDPLTLGLFLFKQIGSSIGEVDSRVTGLQKQLGLSRYESAGISADFHMIANSSEDAYITTKKLAESFSEFSSQLGFAVDYSGQTLETFTTLNKRLGLSVEQATALTSLYKLGGNNTEDQLENTVKQIGAFNTLNGKAFNTKQTIGEIASASASIQVSLGGSVQELTSATLEAKKLGLNLAQVDKIADSLLNFETSIENELKAELLIGKEINLEKARLLAINNDLEGVGKELEKQNINYFEYGKMNRLQQTALAEALGMSREEMSEMLLQQQRQSMTNEEISAQLEGQELSNFKALTFQESLNVALEKMQDIFTNIAEGPLGIIVGGLSSMLSNSIVLHSVLGALTATMGILAIKSGITLVKSIGIAIAEIFGANAKFGPLGLALSGAAIGGLFAALATAPSQAQSVNDAIINPDGDIITTHPDDYLIATKDPQDLANSVGARSFHELSSGGSSAKVESLLEQLVKKNSNFYLDSSKVDDAKALSYSKF